MKPSMLAAGLSAALLAAAILPATADETPKRGGVLTYMIPADAPPAFDGHRETTYAVVHSVAPFYNVLIRLDPSNPAGTTNPRWYEKHVMGSGKFKFAGYELGQSIRGERNLDYYHTGEPYLDGFVGIHADKQSVRIDAIRADPVTLTRHAACGVLSHAAGEVY